MLFTWDGVRSHEFFRGTGLFHATQLKASERGEILSTFWAKHAQQGMVLGGNGRYKIGSKVAVSLPSYQALMLGKPTDCVKNNCQSVQEPSVLENVREKLELKKEEVAVFASWNRIIAAAAHVPSSITNGVYPAVYESDNQTMNELQQQATQDLPDWKGSRKDKYTFELGLEYLKTKCPRLLYISLVDSDEFGHKGNYPEYVRALRTYDEYLDRLIKTLDSMGEYGQQTTLIVTTDHSRGPGPLWVGHGVTKNSEKGVFLFARGRGVPAIGRARDHAGSLNVRPTIEYLMGVEPTGEILPNINLP